MNYHRALRIAELHESIAKEMRAWAFESGWRPEGQSDGGVRRSEETQPKNSPPPSGGRDLKRKEDTLVRLVDTGYLFPGTGIRLISRLVPTDWKLNDRRLRARIGPNPSKPIWEFSGDSVRSLTSLSKTLRDEYGIALPESSFNPCKYWCIDGETPERTLESIAKQLAF